MNDKLKKAEIPRMYVADDVDQLITMLTQSRDNWKKEAERLRTEIENSR